MSWHRLQRTVAIIGLWPVWVMLAVLAYLGSRKPKEKPNGNQKG